ncbi:unnamed protein product [Cyprideis torosa]|uniref:Uncharacterized protein n=1 Tax=Cyprideis torosa TaxID=163714 RepID=A0A7R8WZL3_9CRUS|nr:unnamed protein product [Cyprideis torosa]CAG0909336.1 unnamed protein product [Cyprideis torosa]
MRRSGIFLVLALFWITSMRITTLRLKESTPHTCILECGKPPSRGTRKIWICTPSTTCILANQNFELPR